MNKTMIALYVATLAFTSQASAYTIDGRIADWVAASGSWAPKAGVEVWTQEDQTGSGSFYLDPGWGGQRYDAEAMYLDWDATKLYVAIVTGLPQNNTHNPAANAYGPGDILFNFGGDDSFEFGLVTSGIAGKQVGGLYRTTGLNYGLWTGPMDQGPPYNYPVAVKTGTKIGDATLVYDPTKGFGSYGGALSDTHYLIEAAIPVAMFGSNWGANGPAQELYVWWTAYCANDVIGVEAPAVAEPGTLLLSALGLAGLGFLRRRRSEVS